MIKLTPKQERFIQNIVKGMSQRQAYKDAYNAENMKDETIDTEACLLFNDQKIARRYQELIEKLEKDTLLTTIQKRKMLKEMAQDTSNSITDRIKAIDTDNKMTGEYITKLEADIGIKTIKVELEDE